MEGSAILGSSATVIRSLVFVSAFLIFADAAPAGDEKSIKGFRDAVVALAPDVDPAEAELLSITAHTTARQLARQYRVVGPSVFQNFLIHIGVRQRGYCFQWARDIGLRLKELKLNTLVLHWGAAEAGSVGEHNCVVVTAHRLAAKLRTKRSEAATRDRAALSLLAIHVLSSSALSGGACFRTSQSKTDTMFEMGTCRSTSLRFLGLSRYRCATALLSVDDQLRCSFAHFKLLAHFLDLRCLLFETCSEDF